MARTPSRTRTSRRPNPVSEDFKAGPPEEIVFSRALMEKVFVENPRRNPRARRRNGFVDYMKGVEERGKKKGRSERAVGKAQTATAVVSVGAKAAPKVAAKVAAKVGAKAGARAIPLVGEALMVVGGGKELAKAGYRHYKYGFDRKALKTDVAKVGAGIIGVEDFVPDYERPAKPAKRNPRDVFGPKTPLFGPYTYRVKQNVNGDTLIAVYHGSKRIAHIDAFWAYSMRTIEEHEEEEARRGTRRRLVCATDLRALGAEGRYPNVLAVGHAFMDDDAYKGKGIGRAMYEAMMVEGFAVRQTRIGGQPGPMFFIPDECKGSGNTSADAKRVWASLARDYPSQGTSIRVDAPPVIGSRARANPRRRNPEDDYRMRHRPPEDGPLAHELGKGDYMPADVLVHPERYTGFSPYLPGFWRTLRAAQGRRGAMLRIYRALPQPHTTFREGDWVTLSLAYAKDHLESNVGEGGHIIAADVPAGTLRFAGDDLMEWGYWGPTVEGTPVRRRRNPARSRR